MSVSIERGKLGRLGGGALPTGYEYKNNSGVLELWKGNVKVATQSPDGSWFKNSVETGVGSFHLGQAHSMSSVGQNVGFLNEWSRTSNKLFFFPPWQAVSTDGTEFTPATYLQPTGTGLTTWTPNGAQHTGTVSADYSSTIPAGTNVSVASYTFVIKEAYTGKLTFLVEGTVTSPDTEIYREDFDIALTSGAICVLPLRYPLIFRAGDQVRVRILKANGNLLSVANGVTSTTQMYRALSVRYFKDVQVTGDVPVHVLMSGSHTIARDGEYRYAYGVDCTYTVPSTFKGAFTVKSMRVSDANADLRSYECTVDFAAHGLGKVLLARPRESVTFWWDTVNNGWQCEDPTGVAYIPATGVTLDTAAQYAVDFNAAKMRREVEHLVVAGPGSWSNGPPVSTTLSGPSSYWMLDVTRYGTDSSAVIQRLRSFNQTNGSSYNFHDVETWERVGTSGSFSPWRRTVLSDLPLNELVWVKSGNTTNVTHTIAANYNSFIISLLVTSGNQMYIQVDHTSRASARYHYNVTTNSSAVPMAGAQGLPLNTPACASNGAGQHGTLVVTDGNTQVKSIRLEWNFVSNGAGTYHAYVKVTAIA